MGCFLNLETVLPISVFCRTTKSIGKESSLWSMSLSDPISWSVSVDPFMGCICLDMASLMAFTNGMTAELLLVEVDSNVGCNCFLGPILVCERDREEDLDLAGVLVGVMIGDGGFLGCAVDDCCLFVAVLNASGIELDLAGLFVVFVSVVVEFISSVSCVTNVAGIAVALTFTRSCCCF